MHLLVTGAGGLLGSNVVTTTPDDHTVTATYHTSEPELDVPHEQFDITDSDRFETLLDERSPSVIVNCAAMTDVDGCERHPDQAQTVNGTAPGALASVAAERDIGFVQISTDYVFDGRDPPYAPDDETNPLQVYGQSKLSGERTVRESHPDPLIVRLSFVYGRHGATGEIEGFPAWVLSRLEEGTEMPLFTDQHVTPTRANAAARSIVRLCDANVTGTFHVAARDCVTPYKFGTRLAARVGASTDLLVEGRTDDIDRPAVRPVDTCLSVESTETALGEPLPTLDADIDAML